MNTNISENITSNVGENITPKMGDIQSLTDKTANASNSIVKAFTIPNIKISQLEGPYISWDSSTKFSADSGFMLDAELQFELLEDFYFLDGTKLKDITFKVNYPGTKESKTLDIVNKNNNEIDQIKYTLTWF